MNYGQEKIKERWERMLDYDISFLRQGYKLIAGVDEAGRGPLAGPVTAAAVILDLTCPIYGIDDSKKLCPSKRERLYEEILKQAVCYNVISIDNEEIDEINILQASLKAMCLAVQGLKVQPDIVLVDGGYTLPLKTKVKAVIQGDCTSLSIAAASILSKVTRDRMMNEIDKLYPQYGFSKNKGYPTKEHISALKKYGPCKVHRKSFAPVKELINEACRKINFFEHQVQNETQF